MHACASNVFDRNADHQRGALDAPEEEWSNEAQGLATRCEDEDEDGSIKFNRLQEEVGE